MGIAERRKAGPSRGIKRRRIEEDDEEVEDRVARSRKEIGMPEGIRRGRREVGRKVAGEERSSSTGDRLDAIERQLAKILANEAEILARLRGMEREEDEEEDD